MSALLVLLNSWAGVGAAIVELLQYGWRFLKNLMLPKAVLAARVLAAESQLALCAERLESQGVRRHRFSDGFRWLWVLLAGWWSAGGASGRRMSGGCSRPRSSGGMGGDIGCSGGGNPAALRDDR